MLSVRSMHDALFYFDIEHHSWDLRECRTTESMTYIARELVQAIRQVIVINKQSVLKRRSEEAKLQVYYIVDYSSLVQIDHLERRDKTAIVRCSSDSDSLHVFKDVNFETFLESRADFEHRKDVCYHEIWIIFSSSQHSIIISFADVFVIVQKIENDHQVFVCDTLYSFMKHDTLDDQIKNIKTIEARLALRNKAVWCFQMTSAIAHIHFTTHTFYMNIKSINFILDSNQNLILIDWKQSETSLYTLAFEANDSWDVKEAKVESSSSDDADYEKNGEYDCDICHDTEQVWEVSERSNLVSISAFAQTDVFSCYETQFWNTCVVLRLVMCSHVWHSSLCCDLSKGREVDCHDLAKVSKHVTWHACRCNTSMTIIECSSLKLDMSTFSIRMTEQKRERLSNLTRTGRFNVKAWSRLIKVWTISCTTIRTQSFQCKCFSSLLLSLLLSSLSLQAFKIWAVSSWLIVQLSS